MSAGCNHDHAPSPPHGSVAEALARAARETEARGQRWTEPRRRVYELLLQAAAPVKAYDIMEAYADRAAKPPTVYRALEFLEQSGLAHRIPSLNAFVACAADGPEHAAAFLICDCCGSAQEFDPGAVSAASAAARAEGFAVRAVALEVRGRCRRCA
jgi:Fur family zinc uptake transcriptional regulator